MRILHLRLLVLSLLAFAIVAAVAPQVAAQKVIQSTGGFVSGPDATRMNDRLDVYDRQLVSPCALKIVAKMEKHAPQGGKYDLTPNLRLRQPTADSIDWAQNINYDFDVIDAVIAHCSTTK